MPHHTTVDGTRLFYKDWGSGRPIVFSHGWPLNADMWEGQMNALANQGFRCIAHDRRGFGRSDQPWTGYTYDTFADDLAGLMRALDLRDAILVGFSMGGGEVARLVGRHGRDRVAKVALVGAVTPFMMKAPDHPEGIEPSVFEGIRAGIAADRAQFFSDFGKLFLGANRPGAKVSEGALHWTLFMALQASLRGTLQCVHAFSETDFRPDLARFAGLPTLVIHGDDDQIVPIDLTGRVAARTVPGAVLEVYAGAPHGLYVTDQERLTRDLLAFARG